MKSETKLTVALTEFNHLLEKMNLLINDIKSDHNRNEVSETARRGLDLKFVNSVVKSLNDFVMFPEKPRDPGRPVKFPDSKKEKEQFIKYRDENLSLRSIAEETGMSKDMVDRKLKRYGIK